MTMERELREQEETLVRSTSKPKSRWGSGKRFVTIPLMIGLGLGFGLNVLGLMPIPDVQVRWSVPVIEAGRYVPQARQRPGDEIVLVYIGSSGCTWSNAPQLPGLVRGLKQDLLDRARTEGRIFAALGIARDIVVADGIAHLEEFGPFDEVMAGRSWANTGIQKYFYGDLPGGFGATPQIMVVSRTLFYENGHISIKNEQVLARAVGLAEITEWTSKGAPLQVTPTSGIR